MQTRWRLHSTGYTIEAMSVVDGVMGLLAPHLCISCGSGGSVLCGSCVDTYWQPDAARCAGCFRLQKDARVCPRCKPWLPLKAVFIAAPYEGIGAQLVHALKFDLRRQAAVPMAVMLNEAIHDELDNVVVCPVPTAPSRIRQRGFDHAALLAKHLAIQHQSEYQRLLTRTSSRRQVGASRASRIRQMVNEFIVKKTEIPDRVLLVDDVMTTGATLAAASRALRAAGAQEVYAAVFARQS